MKQTLQKLLSLRLLMAFALVMGAYGATWADDFELYSGEITAGDYLVVYNGRALQASVSSNRLGYVDVEINDDVISNTNESLVWTIAKEGDYFTLYNAATSKYAASNGTKNQAKLESKVSDNSRWTVTGNETYEFVNKANKAANINCNLRNNGTYGFACYSTATGGALSLYKKKVSDPSKLNPELSFDPSSVTFNLGQTFSAPTLHTASGFDGTVEYASSDEDVARVDSETGELTLLDEGTTTITASFAGNETYRAGSASYTLTVTDNRIVTTISNDNIEISLTDVATLTKLAPVVKDADNNVVVYTYGSWPTEVSFETISDENAIIGSLDNNSGEITLNAVVGTATLKAYYNFYNVNSTYKPSECTFTIKVYDPNVTYYALVAQYDGKYYAMNSNGGATWGATEVDAVNGKVVTAQSDAISWFITPATTASTTKVKFQNKASGKYLNHTTTTSLSEGATSANWDIDKENDTWKNNSSRTMLYRETANGFKNYSAINANSNGYSDYTHAYTFADGYVRSNLTSTWGTICLPSTVEAEDLAGAKFYSIAGKVVNSANEATSIVLEEETVGLIAGVPYIFELNEGSTKVVAAYQDDEDPATSNNGLVGSLEGQAVDEGMYLLSGGKVVKCGTGCSIAANRAYIDMSQVSVYSGPTAGVKMLGVGGNIADSITAIDGEIRSDVIYNLAGQRLQRPVRGINIIGGKKVLVK